MRNFLHAPTEYDAAGKDWHYNPDAREQFELPGLWLTGEELQSLTLLLRRGRPRVDFCLGDTGSALRCLASETFMPPNLLRQR